MTRGRAVWAMTLGLGMMIALAAASRVPWSADSDGGSLLVLSWRSVSESRDLCREPTAEDLAGLPPHMRPDRICEEALAEYQLTLRLDDEVIVDRVVSPAGARGSRPVYVLERIPIQAGTHRISVEFNPTGSSTTAAADEAEPALGGLSIAETVAFEPGQVVLVTRDGDRGDFVIRQAGTDAQPTN